MVRGQCGAGCHPGRGRGASASRQSPRPVAGDWRHPVARLPRRCDRECTERRGDRGPWPSSGGRAHRGGCDCGAGRAGRSPHGPTELGGLTPLPGRTAAACQQPWWRRCVVPRRAAGDGGRLARARGLADASHRCRGASGRTRDTPAGPDRRDERRGYPPCDPAGRSLAARFARAVRDVHGTPHPATAAPGSAAACGAGLGALRCGRVPRPWAALRARAGSDHRARSERPPAGQPAWFVRSSGCGGCREFG